MTEDVGSPFRYSYATQEAAKAHDVLRRLYVGHDFRLHRVGRRFSYQQEAAGAGPIVVGRVRYGMDADVRLEPLDHLLIVTPRALQTAFRRHLGITPTAYLRRVRLDRAHRDLTAARRAEGDTVAAIARRWGYLHTGRFAADYRAAYGRPPGDTLRG
ncbi:AraC family transcriptional regulator [Micromonospora sp. NPDC051300]|uniref:AraC family transcriptional regulator n=1 Tax=Micromonospora sp. NPDC051300 TaxID=3364286 RepID=UPI003788098E